jgi:hypothetical protein
MTPFDVARRPDGSLTVDLCAGCRAIWFDTYESLPLSPAGTLARFRAIHAMPAADRHPLPLRLPCPLCETVQAATQDVQHTTYFSSYRCRYGHGGWGCRRGSAAGVRARLGGVPRAPGGRLLKLPFLRRHSAMNLHRHLPAFLVSAVVATATFGQTPAPTAPATLDPNVPKHA